MDTIIRHTISELSFIARLSGTGLDDVARTVGADGILEIMNACDVPNPTTTALKVSKAAGIENRAYNSDYPYIEYAVADECVRLIADEIPTKERNAAPAKAVYDVLVSGRYKATLAFTEVEQLPDRRNFKVTEEIAQSRFYFDLIAYYHSKEHQRHMDEHTKDLPRVTPHWENWVRELCFDAYLNAEFLATGHADTKCRSVLRMLDAGFSDDEIVEHLSEFDDEVVREFLKLMRRLHQVDIENEVFQNT